ncbi:MAG TPA: hypothetical protein VIG48_00335 [Jatrophihabitans sp.]
MVEPERNERGDREEDREDLAADVGGRECEPDREAHQPVAPHGTQELLPVGLGRGLARGDRAETDEARRGAAEHAGLVGEEVGDEQRPGEVADRHPQPVHRHLRDGDPLGEDRERHQRHVAGEQLGAADDDQDQAEAEDQPAEQGDQATPDLVVEAGGDDGRQQRAEGDVGTGQEAADERLARREVRLRSTRFDCGRGDLRRRVVGQVDPTPGGFWTARDDRRVLLTVPVVSP